jgi:hypothetical protein
MMPLTIAIIALASISFLYYQNTKPNLVTVTTIPQDLLNNITLSNLTIIVSKNMSFFETLNAGDIIAADVHANTPNGFLRKIVHISTSSNALIIETQQITLREVIKEGSFRASSQLDASDILK